jgi:DNA repair exonuclease SbcCD ATPase subunit
MRNLKFHYVKAINILCFGPEGVAFHFNDYGNVVQIQGINLDNPGTEDDPASNGVGKSSIQELLSIGLYGRTVKSPTKLKGGHFINVLATAGSIEIQWDDYRVVRTFKRSATTGAVTSKLQVWESADHIWDENSEKTLGKSVDTQLWIDQKVGLNHNSFCNVVIFDDSNAYSFLEMDGPTKREFVENLLGLDQYRQYHENAKDYLKDHKRSIEILGREYQLLQDESEACGRRIVTIKQQETAWHESKQREIQAVERAIREKQQKLAITDVGSQLATWQSAQDKIQELNIKIDLLKGKRDKIQEAVKGAREKLESARTGKNALSESVQTQYLEIKAIQAELQKHLDLIGELEALHTGTRCPTCHGVISRDNFGNVLQHSQNTAESCRTKIQIQSLGLETEKRKLSEKIAALSSMESKIKEAEGKAGATDIEIKRIQQEIANLGRMPKPDNSGTVEKVLEAEIVALKKQLVDKQTEVGSGCPYTEILDQANQEHVDKVDKKQNKAKEIEAAEKEIPYYEFWVYAFGDKGIRKYMVDGVIPALNTRTAHWLQYLIDNKIELVFNNELDETITRNSNTAFYPSMSNGERRKINLAVSQAWAYIRMLNSGSCPSLVFLDEITGGGIDRASIVGIYNMIFELAKERQVFVTTHNENLISMLQGCETIRLKKENDVTVLLS